MSFHMTPAMVATIYSHTVLAVSILLAGGGIGFAVGCGIVCGNTIECMVRQPDTRPVLMMDTFIFTGLVGNFPFIILAFGAWFLFANPFIDTLQSTLAIEGQEAASQVGSPATTTPKLLTIPKLPAALPTTNVVITPPVKVTH